VVVVVAVAVAVAVRVIWNSPGHPSAGVDRTANG
jgi:hypothetical protein